MSVLTESVPAAAAASATIPSTMRAAVLFGPGDFRIVDKPVPTPGEGEVLVKVAMCGTCGTDLKIQAHPFPGQPPYGEFTPGHEWTGTVVALGPGVDEFAVGDRVAIEAHKGCGRCDNCVVGKYTACLNNGNRAKGHRASGFTADGGFAEYAVHHINALYKMPAGITWEDAVLVTTAGTGLYGLDVAGVVIARWEGALDDQRLQQVLRHETDEDGDAPEEILDRGLPTRRPSAPPSPPVPSVATPAVESYS